MNYGGLYFPKFPPDCADASGITRSHPPHFRDQQTVKKNVRSDLLRCNHSLLGARDHVHFHFGQVRKPLKESLGSGAEIRNGLIVLPVMLAGVGCKLNDSHATRVESNYFLRPAK